MPKFGGDLFSTIVARIDLLELFHLLVEFELRNLTFCTIRGGGKKTQIYGKLEIQTKNIQIKKKTKEYAKQEENKRICKTRRKQTNMQNKKKTKE